MTALGGEPQMAREDIAPPVGRRLVVRCLASNCGHAALIDQRRYFSNARDWPRAGVSSRFRCLCGSRQASVSYTNDAYAAEGPIHFAALALWF